MPKVTPIDDTEAARRQTVARLRCLADAFETAPRPAVYEVLLRVSDILTELEQTARRILGPVRVRDGDR